MIRTLICLSCFLVLSVSLSGCAGKTPSGTMESEAPAASTMTAATAPAAATASSDTTPQRKQVKGVTDFPVSETATRDKAFLTPLPKGHEDAAAHLPEDMVFRLPFDGEFRISNGYGCESRSWTHQTIGNTESANDFFGLDIATPVGTTVVAPAAGRVLTAQDRSDQDSYGKYIVIDHGQGIHTVYAHLDKLEFEVDHGEPEIHVKAGQKIAESGKSGGQRWAHLHFAIHKDSRISHSGCDVGGKAVVPEPLGGYYGIRSKHVLSAEAGR